MITTLNYGSQVSQNIDQQLKDSFFSREFLKEVGKVTLVATVLFATCYLASLEITALVVAPVWEECIYRGVIQTTFKMLQNSINEVNRTPLSEADLTRQRKIRVNATALLFGIGHLSNDHSTLLLKITQFVLTTISGISFGFLREKTNSIAPSIVAHSANNGIVALVHHIFIENIPQILTYTSPENSLRVFAAGLYSSILAFDYAVYKYSTSSIAK